MHEGESTGLLHGWRQLAEVREHAGGNPCHVDSDSVICYGRARIIEDIDERSKALSAFNRRFRSNAGDVPLERVRNCNVVEITISEMTGGRNESENGLVGGMSSRVNRKPAQNCETITEGKQGRYERRTSRRCLRRNLPFVRGLC